MVPWCCTLMPNTIIDSSHLWCAAYYQRWQNSGAPFTIFTPPDCKSCLTFLSCETGDRCKTALPPVGVVAGSNLEVEGSSLEVEGSSLDGRGPLTSRCRHPLGVNPTFTSPLLRGECLINTIHKKMLNLREVAMLPHISPSVRPHAVGGKYEQTCTHWVWMLL